MELAEQKSEESAGSPWKGRANPLLLVMLVPGPIIILLYVLELVRPWSNQDILSVVYNACDVAFCHRFFHPIVRTPWPSLTSLIQLSTFLLYLSACSLIAVSLGLKLYVFHRMRLLVRRTGPLPSTFSPVLDRYHRLFYVRASFGILSTFTGETVGVPARSHWLLKLFPWLWPVYQIIFAGIATAFVYLLIEQTDLLRFIYDRMFVPSRRGLFFQGGLSNLIFGLFAVYLGAVGVALIWIDCLFFIFASVWRRGPSTT
jgi:hypothetical protein